jgi:hypothetical protein
MRGTRGVQGGRLLAPGLLALLVAEYRRAIAAEQRYEALQHASRPWCQAASRSIFDEFYASAATGEPNLGTPRAALAASRTRRHARACKEHGICPFFP